MATEAVFLDRCPIHTSVVAHSWRAGGTSGVTVARLK
jgi:hypothetical protein